MEFVTTLGENKHYYDEQMIVLQQKATEVLASCGKRPLIALDLDFTLWPANCFEHTMPPYRTVEESQKAHKESPNHHGSTTPTPSSSCYSSSIMKEKILCLDRRTNHERSLVLYPQIKSILEWCADQRIVLTICSKSPDMSIVKQILQTFGIWEWFLFPQVYNSRKTYHFRNLTEVTGLKMNDFLFFDDDPNNITMCTKIGISSCLVDKQVGLTWNTLLDGLVQFSNTHKAINHLASWLSSEKVLSKGSPTHYEPVLLSSSSHINQKKGGSKTNSPRSTGPPTSSPVSLPVTVAPAASMPLTIPIVDLTATTPAVLERKDSGLPLLFIKTE